MLDPRNIHRSKRRTLSLYIAPTGELIVKAPLKLTDAKIFDFVRTKQDWITMRQRQIMQNSCINRNVVAYNTFYYLGQELTPVISNSVKVITKSDNMLLVPAKTDQSLILRRVEKFLRERAKEVIDERARYFGTRLNLSAAEIKTNNNKTRWGVCDTKTRIAINWRAVMLSPALLDYIIVHEFCHLLEFNHTKNFWAIIETILPNWRAVRKNLKNMNWLLDLFRPV